MDLAYFSPKIVNKASKLINNEIALTDGNFYLAEDSSEIFIDIANEEDKVVRHRIKPDSLIDNSGKNRYPATYTSIEIKEADWKDNNDETFIYTKSFDTPFNENVPLIIIENSNSTISDFHYITEANLDDSKKELTFTSTKAINIKLYIIDLG